MSRLSLALVFVSAGLLSGCDLFGDSAETIAAAREADGRAIGSACRHAGRALEDCYALNRKAEKASVFAGWRDMNDYMRENKIDSVPPQMTPVPVARNGRPERADPRSSAPRASDALPIERKAATAIPKPDEE